MIESEENKQFDVEYYHKNFFDPEKINQYREQIIAGAKQCSNSPLSTEIDKEVGVPLYYFINTCNREDVPNQLNSLKKDVFENPDFQIPKESSKFSILMETFSSLYEEIEKYPEALSCYQEIIENYEKIDNSDLGPRYAVEQVFRLQKKIGTYNSKNAKDLYYKYIIEGANFEGIPNGDFFEDYAILLEENGEYSEAVEFYKRAYEAVKSDAYVDRDEQEAKLKKINDLQLLTNQ